MTSVHGGENVNSVPDACMLTVDIRTVPGMDHAQVLEALRARLGPKVTLDPPLADLPPVGTDPAHPFVRCIAAQVAELGEVDAAVPAGLPYFTDGSVLQGAFGQCPTVILGPGEPGQAHQTDEQCRTDRIERCAVLYRAIIQDWCALGRGR